VELKCRAAVKTGTIFDRAREAMLAALLGSRTAADRSTGLGLAARAIVTLVATAAATFVWMAARFVGLVGAASFYFPAILVITLFAGWEFAVAAVATSALLIWTLANRQLPLVPLAIFVLAGLLEVLLAGFLR
jgi:hypothetical protein